MIQLIVGFYGAGAEIINGQQLPHTDRFKYLGVEITRNGIDGDAYLKRRIEETLTAANRLSGMGMNIGGFSPSTNALLYKVFIRPKIEASLCILPPLKKFTNLLDKVQGQILRRIIRASKTCSGIILRSLFQIQSLTFRMKWLRTRFIRRFDTVIESSHILKLSSSRNNSWISRKLGKHIFPIEIGKQQAWEDEMTKTHQLTSDTTAP